MCAACSHGNSRRAIGELRCIDLDRPTSLQYLHAVAVARERIEDLLGAFVDELRSNTGVAPTWTEITASLNEDSGSTVRKRHAAHRS